MMEIADENLIIPLWPDLPDPGQGESANRHGHISGVSNPCLVVMLPPKDKANGGALMICPGGGYAILDWESHVTRPARMLLQEGYAVLGLRYRLTPPSTQPVTDAMKDLEQAIRLVRARDCPLQVQRLAVLGFSAGAHAILSLLSSRAKAEQDADPATAVDGVALICPWPKGQQASELDPGPGAPPAFIAATDDDEAAPRQFVADLEMTWRRTGSAVCVARYARGGHLAFNYTEQGPAIDWLPALLRWLRAPCAADARP
jgi:acetyl esterase/lipase